MATRSAYQITWTVLDEESPEGTYSFKSNYLFFSCEAATQAVERTRKNSWLVGANIQEVRLDRS